jgi:membrane-associated protease RseP (regulator of RpoE activity)
MDKLMIWDLGLLAIFVILVGFFLYKHKSKIKKEGILWLYHTSWGIKLINKTGDKYKKCLKAASYLSVTLGYLLMAAMLWLFGRIVWLYAFHGEAVSAIKLPPIAPLIPYLPQIFKLSWLPPFYFSYWIIILAIIAITHELFHGIFARIYGVKTNTTGFGFFPFFFPVFLAAFVNLDEKVMQKKSTFQQRAVLSAGTFANLLTTVIGIVLMWGFFSLTFAPAGIVYDDYAYNVVNITDIQTINGIPVNWSTQDFSEFENLSVSNNIIANDISYYAVKAVSAQNNLIALYYDSPAIQNNLVGAIKEINGEQINSLDKLTQTLSNYSPGQTVELTLYNGTDYKKNMTLGANPLNNSNSWLGVTFYAPTQSGAIAKLSSAVTAYKNPNIYYEASSDASQFIYDFLWWLVLISFSVALVNMLPAGIFDGGRFFYLTVLSLTKSEKIAMNAFKWITQLMLLALFVVMFFWALNLF